MSGKLNQIRNLKNLRPSQVLSIQTDMKRGGRVSMSTENTGSMRQVRVRGTYLSSPSQTWRGGSPLLPGVSAESTIDWWYQQQNSAEIKLIFKFSRIFQRRREKFQLLISAADNISAERTGPSRGLQWECSSPASWCTPPRRSARRCLSGRAPASYNLIIQILSTWLLSVKPFDN